MSLMWKARFTLFLIICAFVMVTGCAPRIDPTETPLAATATLTRVPATVPTQPAPTSTALPASPTPAPSATAPSPSEEVFEFTWEGSWNVWIANPKISIVNSVVFEISGADARSSWYEGTRRVNLEGTLSEDGSTITGTFWNSDVESLDIILILDPSGAFFTGIADTDIGPGQFCGTRISQDRPKPCRAETP